MKLIFIYGPPAVGKFTVAKELATLTGLKLFHNHLTIDVVTSIFEHGSDSYYKLLRMIRFAMFEEAARINISGIIMTFVYGRSRQKIAEQYAKMIEDNGGEICFVRLYCEKSILAQRVIQEDRRKYGKIVSESKLNEKLGELGEPFAAIARKKSLSLDVGKLTALEAADTIKQHFSLNG